jgi:hypothetical protein
MAIHHNNALADPFFTFRLFDLPTPSTPPPQPLPYPKAEESGAHPSESRINRAWNPWHLRATLLAMGPRPG